MLLWLNGAYADLENTPGTYAYEIETVYIDGTTSARTAPVSVTITEAGQGDVASDVKARAASYGYDVNVTMIDPTRWWPIRTKALKIKPLARPSHKWVGRTRTDSLR